jgi:hypothetical protein
MSRGDREMLSTPHGALPDALSKPNNATLRRIVWFCHKVWHFDSRTYLNKKEIIISSMPKPMLVVSTMLYAWEVQISNVLIHFNSKKTNQIDIKFEKHWFFCWIKEHVEPCCMVLRKTMQGWKKNMCKKTRKIKQNSMGGI